MRLEALAVLFGPNAAGKSNFLDALQLLSKLGTSRTVKEAFDPPYRGKPIESFTIGNGGLKGLIERERLVFSIEVDLRLSDTVVDAVNRQIRDMRRPSGDAPPEGDDRPPARVRERDLRYRVEIEMLPRSGVLRVTDEYLAALIEVKGRASDGAIQMDANERKQACHLGERYWLYAVFDCATPAPRLLRVQNPFAKLLASRLDAGGGGEGLTEGVR